jgi:hypothetical protein
MRLGEFEREMSDDSGTMLANSFLLGCHHHHKAKKPEILTSSVSQIKEQKWKDTG